MDDDAYPFLVGFDEGIVVVKVDDEVFTIDPTSAEALASDLQEMATKARDWEDTG